MHASLLGLPFALLLAGSISLQDACNLGCKVTAPRPSIQSVGGARCGGLSQGPAFTFQGECFCADGSCTVDMNCYASRTYTITPPQGGNGYSFFVCNGGQSPGLGAAATINLSVAGCGSCDTQSASLMSTPGPTADCSAGVTHCIFTFSLNCTPCDGACPPVP